MLTDEQLKRRLDQGLLVETREQMSEQYREDLIRVLTVSGDTELISVPSYYYAAQRAPSLNSKISGLAIIQDEMSHAHIAYRLLEDIGVDKTRLIYEREPRQFKYPYAFDIPLDSWEELVVANAFYDRAGFILLGDAFKHTSYGPWKRALVKVDKEENFHLRHGEIWMRKIVKEPEGRGRLQRAVDWMFLLTVEWFGLPDDLKQHTGQLSYGIKGSSNDTLRQQWLSQAVPLCRALGLGVPARLNDATNKWEVTCPFPARFDASNKIWELDQGSITWDDVLVRWKNRGTMNDYYIERIQHGYREMMKA
jgi:ring-1,2-phenylacetyl-CoA epoxidase subunit PaaA